MTSNQLRENESRVVFTLIGSQGDRQLSPGFEISGELCDLASERSLGVGQLSEFEQ